METTRRRWIGTAMIGSLGALTVPLGDRAWWIIPPIGFVLMLFIPIVIDGIRPVRFTWVLLAAAVSVALAVFLKFT